MSVVWTPLLRAVVSSESFERIENGLHDYRFELASALLDDQDIDTESGQPYCGCDTCEVRELLAYITPRLVPLVIEVNEALAREAFEADLEPGDLTPEQIIAIEAQVGINMNGV